MTRRGGFIYQSTCLNLRKYATTKGENCLYPLCLVLNTETFRRGRLFGFPCFHRTIHLRYEAVAHGAVTRTFFITAFYMTCKFRREFPVLNILGDKLRNTLRKQLLSRHKTDYLGLNVRTTQVPGSGVVLLLERRVD